MSIRTCCLTAAILSLVASVGSAATLYDVNVDLRTKEIPDTNFSGSFLVNGVWNFGTAATLNGAFNPFALSEHYDSIALPGIAAGNLQGWQEDQNNDLVPAIAVNVTGGTINSSCCGFYESDAIWWHGGPPGGGRDYAVVRWIAPSNGTASYAATFIASANPPQSVYVSINGGTDFTGTSAGSNFAGGTTAASAGTFSINAGQAVDFILLGYNSDALYAQVSFTPVPEPSSLCLLGLGAVGLTVLARRRKK